MSEMQDTSRVATTVDTYLSMWNEPDEQRRVETIARAWTSDARYVDPQLQAEGYAEMNAMVSGVQAQFPDHRFRRISGIDTHHDQVRFGWELVAPNGTIVVAGIDVGELAADGRLRRISGFFGGLPEEAPATAAAR